MASIQRGCIMCGVPIPNVGDKAMCRKCQKALLVPPIPKKRCPPRMKKPGAETGNHYVFLTNHSSLSARTIADIYKERWRIEIFFSEIKQSLRIESFVGNMENAVLIQMYTAPALYLLPHQNFLNKIYLSMQHIFQLITINLLGTCSLEEFLTHEHQKTKILVPLACLPWLLSRTAIIKTYLYIAPCVISCSHYKNICRHTIILLDVYVSYIIVI